MWIPYTSSVISVVSNPIDESSIPSSSPSSSSSTTSSNLPTERLIELIKSDSKTSSQLSDDYLLKQGFGTLRDLALGINPLDLNVN